MHISLAPQLLPYNILWNQIFTETFTQNNSPAYGKTVTNWWVILRWKLPQTGEGAAPPHIPRCCTEVIHPVVFYRSPCFSLFPCLATEGIFAEDEKCKASFCIRKQNILGNLKVMPGFASPILLPALWVIGSRHMNISRATFSQTKLIFQALPS